MTIFLAIISFLGGVARAVGGWFGYQAKKMEIRNTQSMRDAVARKDEVKLTDRVEKAVAERDTDEIRKAIAE